MAKKNTNFNAELKNKAYLLEFYQGDSFKECFSFCLPPQNEQITLPQKVYETKTYDGSVIDDYGNDIESLNISGSTHNTEVRTIYLENNKETDVTGEEEIFILKDLLMKYGKRDKLIDKHVFLRDLSSPYYKNWEVFPKELRIERSKDSPFSYNYSFSLLAQRWNYQEPWRKKSWLELLMELLDAYLSKLMKILELIQQGMEYFEQAMEIINTIKTAIAKVEGLIQEYVAVISGYIEGAANLINEVVGLGDYVLNLPARIYSMGVDVFNSTKELLKACNNLKNWVRGCGSEFTKSIDLVTKQYNASGQEVLDEWNKLTNQMCQGAEQLHATCIMATTNNSILTVPGGEESDTVRVAYGFTERILKDNDTWDDIAYEVYGDATLGTFLSFTNGSLADDKSSKIVAGKKIYLPILEETQSLSSNEVYNEPGIVDNYGNDIGVSDGGDFTVINGDLDPTSGSKNLTQALMNRLSTSIKSRIRNVVYGIRTNVGDSLEFANNYLASSIHETVMMDPRVREITNMKWMGKGTEIHIEFTYRDVNNQTQEYRG